MPTLQNKCVTSQHVGNEVLIRVRGPFTFNLRQEFRESYYTYPSDKSYVVDLSEVTLIDSSAMGMLIILRTHAGGDKADLRLKNLSARLRNVFKTLKMDEIFAIT